MKDVLSVGVPESGGADRDGEDGSLPRLTCLAEAMFSWEVLGSMHVHCGADSHWDVFKVGSYKISLL